MSKISTRKSCVKCDENNNIVPCDGCKQGFCEKHLFEHREELLEQMDDINDQCQRFRETIQEENVPSTILSDINQWEEQSIQKIRSKAENLRDDFRILTERTIEDFNQSIKKITTDIESTRQRNDLTELDLREWTNQLHQLQGLFSKPFPISMINDEKQSLPIHLIQLKYQSPFNNSIQSKVKTKRQSRIQNRSHFSDSEQINSSINDKFDRLVGKGILSNDYLTFTSIGYSSISGLKQYDKGIHRIRFHILDKKNNGIFLGILTLKEEIRARASELPSAYGWRDFDRTISNGKAQYKGQKENNIEINDQITLTLDCDHANISLTHHQLNENIQMYVDLNKCPLPWKFILSSYGQDTIKIRH